MCLKGSGELVNDDKDDDYDDDDDDLPPLPPVIDYEMEMEETKKDLNRLDLPSVGSQLQSILSAYDGEVVDDDVPDEFMHSEDLMSLNSGLVELLEHDQLDYESEIHLRSKLHRITRKRTATNINHLQGK